MLGKEEMNMEEVVLVNPAIELGALAVKEETERMYPYSIVFLSNHLEKNRVPTKIFDLTITPETELFAYIKEKKPRLMGFTSATENRFTTIHLIRETKKLSPNTKVIVGGRFFTFQAEQAIRRIPEIDIVCRGEGEITLHEIVKHLDDYTNVLGITYRGENGEPITNPERPVHWNIDELALDYQFLPKGYPPTVTMRNFEKEKIQAAPILVGRNCPHQCVFCIHRLFAYRARSLKSVFEEIDHVIKNYGIKWFMFTDPSFCERRDFIHEFCQKLIDENYGIKWYCEARADTPLELLELMARAGCVSVDFSLESGSEKVLKELRKDINPQLVLEFARKCKQLGLRSWIFTIISCPGERREDAEKTLEMINQLLELDGSDREINIGTSVMKIYPGTTLETIAKQRGILAEDFDWFDEKYRSGFPWDVDANLPDYIEHLTPEYIQGFINKVNYLGFKHRNTLPSLFKKTVKQFTRDPLETLKKIKNRLLLLSKGR